MIECPNIVFVDGKPVLLYCPQGLDKAELDYNNIYPNTYKIFQDFDPEKAALVGGTPIINLTTGSKLMLLKDLTLLMVVRLLLAGLVSQTWTIQLTNTTTKVL